MSAATRSTPAISANSRCFGMPEATMTPTGNRGEDEDEGGRGQAPVEPLRPVAQGLSASAGADQGALSQESFAGSKHSKR